MRVNIEAVKANPFRDFDIDPISDNQLEKLIASYNQLGQFGAVPVRPHPTEKGCYQQASGHHTIDALRRAGATEINVESRERSDDEMALLMGIENLTQRNNNAGAITDAVAAQAYLAAVAVLTGTGQYKSSKSETKTRQHLLNEGPGRDAIRERIAAGEIMITRNQIASALQTLKATGKMAEIMGRAFDAAEAARVARAEAEARRIQEIKDDQEREQAKAKEAERLKAEKKERDQEEAAAAAQAELEVAYDVDCIHLFENQAQEKTFREVMLSENGRRFIPKASQVELAKIVLGKIEAKEKKQSRKLGSNTVKELINAELREAMMRQKQMDEEERERLLLENDRKRVNARWSTVRRGLQQAESALGKLVDEQDKWGHAEPFPINMDAVTKLRGIGKRFDKLAKELTGL